MVPPISEPVDPNDLLILFPKARPRYVNIELIKANIIETSR